MARKKRYTVNQKEFLKLAERLRKKGERVLKRGGHFKPFPRDSFMKYMFPNPEKNMPRKVTSKFLKEFRRQITSAFPDFVGYRDADQGIDLQGKEAMDYMQSHSNAKYMSPRQKQISQKFKNQIQDRWNHEEELIIKNTLAEIEYIEDDTIREKLEDLIATSIEIAGKKETASIIKSVADQGATISDIQIGSPPYRYAARYMLFFAKEFQRRGGEGVLSEEDMADLENQFADEYYTDDFYTGTELDNPYGE